MLLIYLKDRPFVVGNGKDNLSVLIINKFGELGIKYLENLNNDLMAVIPNNEKRIVSWKHNLGNGARALILEDEKIKNELSIIVQRAAIALDIKFASIDIAVIQGEYHVMEVNSGIMIEYFSTQASDLRYNYYEITKNIYRKALNYLFD